MGPIYSKRAMLLQQAFQTLIFWQYLIQNGISKTKPTYNCLPQLKEFCKKVNFFLFLDYFYK